MEVTVSLLSLRVCLFSAPISRLEGAGRQGSGVGFTIAPREPSTGHVMQGEGDDKVEAQVVTPFTESVDSWSSRSALRKISSLSIAQFEVCMGQPGGDIE